MVTSRRLCTRCNHTELSLFLVQIDSGDTSSSTDSGSWHYSLGKSAGPVCNAPQSAHTMTFLGRHTTFHLFTQLTGREKSLLAIIGDLQHAFHKQSCKHTITPTDRQTDRQTISTWRRAVQEVHADISVHMAEPGCRVTGSEKEHPHAGLQLCLMGQVAHHINLAPANITQGLAKTDLDTLLLQGHVLQALSTTFSSWSLTQVQVHQCGVYLQHMTSLTLGHSAIIQLLG